MSKDSQLQADVLAEFSWEPSVTAGHIGVTASSGVITLSGHVDSYAEKLAVEAATRRVKGVLGVAEEIEVRLPFDTKRSDDAIAAAAIERLSWNVSVPRNSVMVTVREGWVTLTGELDYWFQKEAVEQDIRPLHGVVGISNQTTIKPRIDTVDLGEDIRHALHRSWFYRPDSVHVRAEGGKVTLSGTVTSLHDRNVAANTAWSADGTTDVENDIVVV